MMRLTIRLNKACSERGSRTSTSSHKWEAYRWLQKGLDARREEEAYLKRYVTDEQRSRRLIFSSTPWAVQHWRFWGVARSTRIIHIRAFARAFQNRQLCDGAAIPASDLVH